MSKPVNEIQLTTDQLNTAVQTYLNEHIFREAVRVIDVTVSDTSYQKTKVTVSLGDEA